MRQNFEGMLFQRDSSKEKWIPGYDNYYSLIVFLYDSSHFCLGAKTVEKDNVIEHFEILKSTIKNMVNLFKENS